MSIFSDFYIDSTFKYFDLGIGCPHFFTKFFAFKGIFIWFGNQSVVVRKKKVTKAAKWIDAKYEALENTNLMKDIV